MDMRVIPATRCPMCGEATEYRVSIIPGDWESFSKIVIACSNPECDFQTAREPTVEEEWQTIYSYLSQTSEEDFEGSSDQETEKIENSNQKNPFRLSCFANGEFAALAAELKQLVRLKKKDVVEEMLQNDVIRRGIYLFITTGRRGFD